jgi:hypothetical protein
MRFRGGNGTDEAGRGAVPSAPFLARWEKRENLAVGLFLAAFLAVGLLSINPYLTGADQISYITIAQKYARGQLGQAVNGYWSPLFSWLLAPFLMLGLEAVAASKILTLLTAVLLLWNLSRLSRQYHLTFPLRMIALLAMGPILLLCFVFINSGPDILVAALILGYLAVLLDPGYLDRPYSWLATGLWAGLAFLAKSYALFFGVLFILCIHGVFFIWSRTAMVRKRVVVRLLAVLLVFLCVSGPWISAISLKYHGLMLSSTMRTSLYLVLSPRGDTGSHPTKKGGLFAPPNPTAVCTWEDPTHYLKGYRLSSRFHSRSNFRFWLAHMAKNFRDVFNIFFLFSFLSPAILLAALILAFFPRRHSLAFFSWLALALYTSGYIVLFVIDRYLILDLVLIVLLGVMLLSLLKNWRHQAARLLRRILTGLFLFSFLVLPHRYLSRFQHGGARFYVSERYTDSELYKLGQVLLTRVPRGARIASNACYGRTHFLAYYLGAQYYGIITPETPPDTARAELARFKIDYVFFWSQVKPTHQWINSYKEMTHGKMAPLWVYRFKRSADALLNP